MYTKDALARILDEVIDPELGIGIYTLGLVYSISIEYDQNGAPLKTIIRMTFTSPFCPYADVLLEQVESAITIHGFGTPSIELTFDPPWEPTEELRSMLGL